MEKGPASAESAPRNGSFVLWAVVYSAWIGLAGSYLELAWWLSEALRGKYMFFNPQSIWMTPLFYTCLAVFTGLVVLPVTARLPERWRGFSHIFVVTTVTVTGLLFLFHPQIHKYAILLLAMGLATQFATWARKRSPGLPAFISSSVRWMAGIVIVASVGYNIGGYALERIRIERQTPAGTDQPNIVLVILDTVRAWSMGVYNDSLHNTPFLNELSARAALFEHAVSAAPWTTPSHATMFTGRWPHETDVDSLPPHRLPDRMPTVAEVLNRYGYATGGFVANVQYAGHEPGFDRGFQHFEDYRVNPGELLIASEPGRALLTNPTLRRLLDFHGVVGRQRAEDINSRFLRWVDRLPGDRPFFAFLNYFDAHQPYFPPPPFTLPPEVAAARRLDLMEPEPRGRLAAMTDRNQIGAAANAAEQMAYERSIEYVDQQLRALFEAIERRGLGGNTIIIVTSDHGELFGMKRLFAHGKSLYSRILHVPLIVTGPSVPAGGVVDDSLVSLRDVAATLLDLAGIRLDTLPGTSFAGRIAGRAHAASPLVLSELAYRPSNGPRIPNGRGDIASVFRGDWHLILNGNGELELYAFRTDPTEQTNLAADPEHKPVVDELLRLLSHSGGWPKRGSPGSSPLQEPEADRAGAAGVEAGAALSRQQ